MIKRLSPWLPLLAIAALVTAMKPWQTFTQAQDAIAVTQRQQAITVSGRAARSWLHLRRRHPASKFERC